MGLCNGDIDLDEETFKNRYPLSHNDKLLGQSHVTNTNIFSNVDSILRCRHT